MVMFGSSVLISKRSLIFGIAVGFGFVAMVNLFTMVLFSNRTFLNRATLSESNIQQSERRSLPDLHTYLARLCRRRGERHRSRSAELALLDWWCVTVAHAGGPGAYSLAIGIFIPFSFAKCLASS